VWRWDSQEPFGDNPADENPGGAGTFDLPLRLPGQYYDAESGLYQNNFREYDPSLGRFPESDPIGLAGGSLSPYVYVYDDPLRQADPQGLFVGPAAAAGVEALITIAGALIANNARQKAEEAMEEQGRTIPQPKKPSCGCTCICRADADDRIPGNIKPGLPRFAFGEATAENCPKAVKEAKRRATHNLRMQPKHIPCKCAGK